jgi:FkbM family methyltransferase
MIYRGQHGQDRYILENFFTNNDGQIKKNGYFVDIGAHNGLEASASYVFEDIGWDGICVEPLPKQFNELKSNRKVQCIHAAISNLDVSYVEFLEVTGNGYIEMLSGIKEKLSYGHIGRIDWESSKPEYLNTKKENIQVPNYRFNDLITKTHINFLSIDTEGCDHEIINSIDYDKYQIDVICFEDNGCAYEHRMQQSISNLNFINNYTLIGNIRQDYILVENKYLASLSRIPSKEGLTNYFFKT